MPAPFSATRSALDVASIAPATLLPTPQWARDGLIRLVSLSDVLHDLRRDRDVYFRLPCSDVIDVVLGTIVRLRGVSEDEEFALCQVEDRLTWICRLSLII